MIRDAKHRHAIERRCHARNVFERPWHEDAVCRRCGVERLTKPAARQHSVVQIGRRHDQHIDVPAQCEVLKPIVEQHHRGIELLLGKSAGEMAIGAHEHRNTRQRARQHLWLVARVLNGLEDAIPIAHDHHTISCAPSRVTAAQNCGTLTHVEQHPRQRRDDGRFAAAANRQVADTDDRAIETPSRLRMPFVPRAPHPRDVSVGRAQNTQWITRKGRTTANG